MGVLLKPGEQFMNNKREQAIKESERNIYNRGYGERDILPDKELMTRLLVKREKWINEKLLMLKPGAKILDIGCGTGHTSIALAKLGFSCIGIDLSETRIEKARKEASSLNLDINFHIGDAENPPFPPASFDAVYCNAILHHLPNIEEDLLKYKILLKPGGYIFSLEPALLNPFAFIRRRFFPTSVHTPDEHPFIPYLFLNLFRRHYDEVKYEYFYILSLAAPITEKLMGKKVGYSILSLTLLIDKILCKIPGVRELSWYVGVCAKKGID